jgi:hypothetical protein
LRCFQIRDSSLGGVVYQPDVSTKVRIPHCMPNRELSRGYERMPAEVPSKHLDLRAFPRILWT